MQKTNAREQVPLRVKQQIALTYVQARENYRQLKAEHMAVEPSRTSEQYKALYGSDGKPTKLHQGGITGLKAALAKGVGVIGIAVGIGASAPLALAGSSLYVPAILAAGGISGTAFWAGAKADKKANELIKVGEADYRGVERIDKAKKAYKEAARVLNKSERNLREVAELPRDFDADKLFDVAKSIIAEEPAADVESLTIELDNSSRGLG